MENLSFTNISFSIGSILFIVMLLVVCIIKRVGYRNENKIYLGLVITSLIGLILDNISYFMTISLVDYNSSVYKLITKLIFCYYDIWGILFLLYIFAVCFRKKEELDKYNKYKNIVIKFILPLLTIANLFLPIEYIENVTSLYPTGISVNLSYFMAILGIVVMCCLLLKNKKYIASKEFIPLWFLIVFSTITMIVQFVVPGLILLTSVEALVTFIMYFTIENPDVKMIEQLELAKEAAEKANSAKTDFLSSMSHEIRTPLNAIVGFSDYIMTSNTLEEAKENAQDIISASNTLLEIVNGILDISKIEAGKLEITNSKYNARNTFEELAKLIVPKMQEKGLDFSYYIAPDIPETLFGDHANIKKVITNLLSNAYKYTDKGFVRYEVNCINSSEVTKLIITVEDSGRGIKKESIDKLFTKFQRLEEDRNTTIEGTGLGLAITKQLVELMGGKILVHTVYGEGSKFTVVLNQRITTSANTEEILEIKDTLDLTDKKLLIVDDNALNIKVATKILERYKANNVTSVDSGFACIDKVKANEVYDVILLDDMMPKMGGVETLKKLREIPGFNQPVVVLTANAITGMREKYLADGFDDYLAKPIEKEELVKVMNRVLDKNVNVKQENTNIDIQSQDVSDEIKKEIIPVEENIEDTLENTQKLTPITELKNSLVEQLETETLDVETNTTESSVKEDDTLRKKHSYEDKKDFLIKKGIDLDKALELLGDMEMYDITLKDFLDEADNKWLRIRSYKQAKDMENYAIEVHSLKSDSKYLGFMGLANIAYEHELKSKEKDIDFVNENFGRLENEYNKVMTIIDQYNNLHKDQFTKDDISSDFDNSIL